MKKTFKKLGELHHEHQITHRIIFLTSFTILTLLAVYGLSRVRADQNMYAPVPNANVGVCYRIDTDFNNPNNHVSCKTYRKICQTTLGTLVECGTGEIIN